MSRTARLEAILQIVHQQVVNNQAELVVALAQRGIVATQATVSRDMRALALVKVATADGGSQYLPSDEAAGELVPSESLRSMFQQSVTEVQIAESLLVIRTPIGFANAVALTIDKARLPEVAGTIAGDDTILILLRKRSDRARMVETFRHLMQ